MGQGEETSHHSMSEAQPVSDRHALRVGSGSSICDLKLLRVISRFCAVLLQVPGQLCYIYHSAVKGAGPPYNKSEPSKPAWQCHSSTASTAAQMHHGQIRRSGRLQGTMAEKQVTDLTPVPQASRKQQQAELQQQNIQKRILLDVCVCVVLCGWSATAIFPMQTEA